MRAAGRLWRAAWIVACGLLAALAFPTAAPAKRGLTTGFENDEFRSPDPGVRSFWLDRTMDTGAGLIRLPAFWPTIAPGPQRPPDPTNPGSASYDFSSLDDPVRDAAAQGLAVMLTINIAPAWAEAPGKPPSTVPTSWKPNPSDVADFAQAIASRYSGRFDPDGFGPEPPLPAVESLQVWNEPNTSGSLTPQFVGKTAVSPALYRGMLNAAYDAVKAVNPKMLVVTGGTAPYGDPPGGPYPAPGVERVQPVAFWEQVLCVHPVKAKKKKKKGASQVKYVRTSGCPPATFDVLGHHPIDNTGAGPLASGPLPGDASTPDLGRITRVLRGAEKAGTVLPGHHPVWVTEFWWDSDPPNPSGAKLAVQARWIEQSLYLFWKAGASAAINFRLSDTSERPNVRAGLQSGVFFQDGRSKPSLTAFRFPFVTERINKRTLRAWGKSPAAGKLVIQRKARGRWLTIKKIRVGQGAVFVTQLRLRGKQRLRAQVAGERSLVWKQAGSGAGGTSDAGPPWRKILLALTAAIVLVLVAAAILRRRQVVRRRRARLRRMGMRATAR